MERLSIAALAGVACLSLFGWGLGGAMLWYGAPRLVGVDPDAAGKPTAVASIVRIDAKTGRRSHGFDLSLVFTTEHGRSVTAEADELFLGGLRRGQQVTVAYMPEAPGEVRIVRGEQPLEYTLFYGLVIAGGAVVLGTLGMFFTARLVRLIRLQHRVLGPGTRVWADMVEPQMEPPDSKGRQYGFAVAEWQDPSTGQRHRFRSHLLRRRDELERLVNQTVGVWMDPNDPTQYVMDRLD